MLALVFIQGCAYTGKDHHQNSLQFSGANEEKVTEPDVHPLDFINITGKRDDKLLVESPNRATLYA